MNHRIRRGFFAAVCFSTVLLLNAEDEVPLSARMCSPFDRTHGKPAFAIREASLSPSIPGILDPERIVLHLEVATAVAAIPEELISLAIATGPKTSLADPKSIRFGSTPLRSGSVPTKSGQFNFNIGYQF